MRLNPAVSGPRSGFTLLMMSILLTIASLILASILPGGSAGDANQKSIATVQKLQKVEEATRAFMASQGRRPCPADGSYGVNTTGFGIEAANPGTCTPTSGMMGPNATPTDCGSGIGCIVSGVIPTKTLGLPDDYAFDDWGRRIDYVVDTRATSSTLCYSLSQKIANHTGAADLVIHDGSGTTIDNTMYAYVSHGPDGHGAFPTQGSTVANRINTGSTDADQNTNAGSSNDGNMTYNTTNFNVRVQKAGTSTFDDAVYYRQDIKTLLPGRMQTAGIYHQWRCRGRLVRLVGGGGRRKWRWHS